MSNQQRDPFDTFEKSTIRIAVIGLILLILVYFSVPSLPFVGQNTRDFLQAIIANLIPTLLIFLFAYAVFFRRIQKLRSERDAQKLAQMVAEEVAQAIRMGDSETEFLEELPASFRDDLNRASELWVVTVTANTLLNNFYSILEARLKAGMTFNVLMVDPISPAFEMAMSRAYIKADMEEFRHVAYTHLRYLKNLYQVAPQQVEVKTINNPLTFGAYLLDPTHPQGTLHLRHYPYKTPGGAKPCVVLTVKRSKRWVGHYQQEIQALWEDAKQWKFD